MATGDIDQLGLETMRVLHRVGTLLLVGGSVGVVVEMSPSCSTDG